MSNLSDLLPSGAGGKSFDFVASGTLANGQAVGLRSDGKVQAISSQTGAATVFQNSTTTWISSCFDSNSNKIIIAYTATSNYGFTCVGTISGSSISFGTPSAFESATTTYISASYDSGNSKVVVCFRNSSGYGAAKVGTLSGTSVSFPSAAVVFNSDSTTRIASTYFAQSGNTGIAVFYRDSGDSSKGNSNIGLVSGTSIAWGTEVNFSAGSSIGNYVDCCYNTTDNTVYVVWQDPSNSDYGTVKIANHSSYVLSYGGSVVFHSAATTYVSADYDATNNKTVIGYANDADSNKGFAKVFTSNTAFGDSKSGVVGSAVSFTTSANANFIDVVCDSGANKTHIAYDDGSDTNKPKIVTGTVSGDRASATISFTSPVTLASTAGTQYTDAVYDSNANKVVIAYQDQGNSNNGTALTYDQSGFLSSNFVGITEAAIANAATGAVTLQGGINTTAELGTSSSTFNTAVEVAGDGTAGSILYDPTNNKVIALYADGDNSNYGTAKVGTVSGTSTSWGSATVFESATATQIHSVYDVNAQRVVVVYQDGGNSSYPTVVIGTVAGTGISFGSPVVALSSSANIEVTYDAGQQKCLVTYRPASNSIFLMVGTVSGTSISFGSPLTVSSAANGGINGIVYDANAAKSVLFWGTGLNAEAAVATISGTSVSVGSTVQYSSGTNLQRGSAVYDSVAQKVVTVAKNSNNDDSTANVGTVSGTSISFGTEVIADSTINQSGESAIVYDVAQNKILYVFGGNPGSGQRMYSQVGTVSGTTTTWSTPVELATNYHYVWGLAYNSSTASNVLLYSDNGSADILEAQVATIAQDTLTVGSTYYVQDDGTLGTGSTSIVAGEALSATSINLVNT